MAVKKRFTKSKGEHEAVLLADIGALRYRVTLFVEGEAVEERTGFLPDIVSDKSSTTLLLTGGDFRALVSCYRNTASVVWS